MAEIHTLTPKKPTPEYKQEIVITYPDGSTETHFKDFLGQSIELPAFVVIGDNDPQEITYFVHTDNIKGITVRTVDINEQKRDLVNNSSDPLFD